MRNNFYHWFAGAMLVAFSFGAEVAHAVDGRFDWFLIVSYGLIGIGASIGTVSAYKNEVMSKARASGGDERKGSATHSKPDRIMPMAGELPVIEDSDLTWAIAAKLNEFYPEELPRDTEKNHRLARAIQRLPELRERILVLRRRDAVLADEVIAIKDRIITDLRAQLDRKGNPKGHPSTNN